MITQFYFPESDQELTRLEMKTDLLAVIDQSRWAGLSSGMRVLDVGCGPGATTAALSEVATGGQIVGIDRSAERIAYAKLNYNTPGVHFIERNFFDDLSDLGMFDFVWMRFIHEYFRKEAYQLTEHIANSVKAGGILCLADLDRNGLNHYGIPVRLERNIQKAIECLMINANYDPYAGAKLYGYLYDLGFVDIRVDIRAHHLIYGKLNERDRINLWQKLEFGGRRSGWSFEDYEDGFIGFEREYKEYFLDERRFFYTPLIISCGIKSI